MDLGFAAPASTYLTKSEFVVQAIRQMVTSGAMKPGDRLVVGRIAKQLSVSDTPVREAIKQLVSDGFLEESPHIGAIVPVFTLEEVRETFHMRAVLAALGVRLNADFYTPEVIARIDEIIAQGAVHIAANDKEAYGRVNSMFHANLFYTEHFKSLHNTYLGMMRRTDRYRAGFRGHIWDMHRSHASHVEIRNALVAGDYERAADLIQVHELDSMQPLIDFIHQEQMAELAQAAGVEE